MSTVEGSVTITASPTRRAFPQPTRIDVGDLAFRVLASRGGERDGEVYVLVHGIGTSHRYLARLHAELADRSDVYSIDLPGFAGLPKPGRTLTVADMASALAAVLDTLDLRRVVLVGHSMGAQWVVETAAQRPDIAACVVVMGPVADDLHRNVWAQSLALTIDTLGEPLDGNMLVFTDYLRCGPRWYLRQLRQMLTYRIEDRITELAGPVLILRGKNDTVAGSAWTARLRDRAADARVVAVPGRHLVQHSAAAGVATSIRRFVRFIPGSSR